MNKLSNREKFELCRPMHEHMEKRALERKLLPPEQFERCPSTWDGKLQCQKPAGYEGPHLYRSEGYGHIWGAQFITNDGQVWNLRGPEENDETDV